MKKILLPCTLFLLMACHNEGGYKKAEDAQDAAREFIQASLDGNYDKARFYLYRDSTGINDLLLDKWKKNYDKWSQEDKVGHKDASIIVVNTESVNDSTLNFTFYNSYKPDTTTIKVVRINKEWLIDLKDIH